MNYFRFYVGDYQRDTSKLSVLEHGAYMLLLSYYYAEEEPLPVEREQVYTMVRALHEDSQRAVDKILEKYFHLRSDGYHNNRADHEITVSQKARDNGSKGGRPETGYETERRTGSKTPSKTGSETGSLTGSGTGEGGGSVHPPTTNHHPPTTSQRQKNTVAPSRSPSGSRPSFGNDG